jgi:SAM-dependent methyltransferase
MHRSSLENMSKCYRRFIRGSELEASGRVTVLDVGGADVNGSYRDVFDGPQFTYLGADLAPAEGVAIVLDDPYRIPLDDASVDIVVSGQMLEHCEFFWLAFAEMMRVVKPSGFVFLIAPSAGPIHRYPVDCYRFYPDGFRALAKYANCETVEIWQDERGPWNDLVGVFRRRGAAERRTSDRPKAAPARDPAPSPLGRPEEEATRGDANYRDVLSVLHRELEPSFYLEIGVRHGASLALARCPAIGIDPSPEITVALPPTASVVPLTSDEFFDEPSRRPLPQAPDLVFIDGMHLFENALRDFMHVERLAAPGTFVVLDDVFPSHPAQASRSRRTRAWTGDVWKLHACLRSKRPDLFLLPLDASPAGLLLIAGLDPANRVIWDGYNPLVRAMAKDVDPPADVLARKGAHPSMSPAVARVAAVLKQARGEGDTPPAVVRKLRAALAETGPGAALDRGPA